MLELFIHGDIAANQIQPHADYSQLSCWIEAADLMGTRTTIYLSDSQAQQFVKSLSEWLRLRELSPSPAAESIAKPAGVTVPIAPGLDLEMGGGK